MSRRKVALDTNVFPCFSRQSRIAGARLTLLPSRWTMGNKAARQWRDETAGRFARVVVQKSGVLGRAGTFSQLSREGPRRFVRPSGSEGTRSTPPQAEARRAWQNRRAS